MRGPAFNGCVAGNDLPRTPAELACLAGYGVLYRGDTNLTILDPRDPQLPPGTLRLDCAEGYLEGTFTDTL